MNSSVYSTQFGCCIECLLFVGGGGGGGAFFFVSLYASTVRWRFWLMTLFKRKNMHGSLVFVLVHCSAIEEIFIYYYCSYCLNDNALPNLDKLSIFYELHCLRMDLWLWNSVRL